MGLLIEISYEVPTSYFEGGKLPDEEGMEYIAEKAKQHIMYMMVNEDTSSLKVKCRWVDELPHEYEFEE